MLYTETPSSIFWTTYRTNKCVKVREFWSTGKWTKENYLLTQSSTSHLSLIHYIYLTKANPNTIIL